MTGDVGIIETHCVDYFAAESPRTKGKGGWEGGRVDHEKRGAYGDEMKAVRRGKLRVDVWGCKVNSIVVNKKKAFTYPRMESQLIGNEDILGLFFNWLCRRRIRERDFSERPATHFGSCISCESLKAD